MRWLLIPLFSLSVTACGIKRYIPHGPVMDDDDRAELLGTVDAPEVLYLEPPAVPYPVLPLQVWGATYDLDLVLVSDHPDYNMHEYSRIKTPQGDVWLAKDALEANFSQSIVADIDNINEWAPELTIKRKQYPVEVVDNSTEDWLDIKLSYENLAGEQVAVTYEGKMPGAKTEKKRNGDTMGHSRDYFMAVLDVPEKEFAKNASITINGEERKIEKLLGLVKLQVVLRQTQGGFSTTNHYSETAPEDEIAFSNYYKTTDGGRARADWHFKRGGKKYKLIQKTDFRELVYTYRVAQGAVELLDMDVTQFGYDVPATHIEVRPALPDMRRKFMDTHTSRFVVDINGQRNHAYGRIECWWDGDAAKIKMIPEGPAWVADRPMLTTIMYREGKALTEIRRIPVEE